MNRYLVLFFGLLCCNCSGNAQHSHIENLNAGQSLTVRVGHYTDGMLSLFSGVLINGNTVFTAAHGVSIYSKRDTQLRMESMVVNSYIAEFKEPASPDSIIVLINNKIFKVNRVVVHPNFANNSNFDIAALVLDTTIESLLVISNDMTIVRPFVNDTVGYFGFSAFTNVKKLPRNYLPEIKLNMVSSIDTSGLLFHTLQNRSFDGPYNSLCGPGDSGGPVFTLKNGTLFLCGLVKGNTANTINKKGEFVNRDPQSNLVLFYSHLEWMISEGCTSSKKLDIIVWSNLQKNC